MKVPYLAVSVALLSIFTLPLFANEPEAATTSGQEVKQEVGEAVDSIQAYSADKRDEAVAKAKEALDDLDKRIDAWQANAKAEKAALSAELKEQRAQLSDHYEKLKNATEENWEETKTAFVTKYRDLEAKFKDADKE